MADNEIARVESTCSQIVRFALALFVIFVAFGYSVLVARGVVTKDNHLDGPLLGILVLSLLLAGALIWPQILLRMKNVKVGGVEFQMLERIEQRQDTQEDVLRSFRMLLPLMFPEPLRPHLVNLLENTVGSYVGNHNLRGELRRLVSMGIIKKHGNKTIGSIRDGQTFNLADVVHLTEIGADWARRIKAFNEESSRKESSDG